MKTYITLTALAALLTAPLYAAPGGGGGGNSGNGSGMGTPAAGSTTSNKQGESPFAKPYWIGNFGEGQVIIALEQITSVSKQKYVLDGGYVIREIVIDTTGNNTIRIYYISPVSEEANISAIRIASDRMQDLLKQGNDRVGSEAIDPTTAVTKNYPTTTHAHTIEFRVANVALLDSVYNSIVSAWLNGRGMKYQIN